MVSKWFTMLMTNEELRKICKQHKLYSTPEINDRLFCNLRGFRSIANLEPYTGLKTLFLEGNALQDVDGLPALEHLRCLCVTTRKPLGNLRTFVFLQENSIHDLTGLQRLPELEVLNVSNNRLDDLSGVAFCTSLQTLICMNNQISKYESVAHLLHCQQLSTVDLRDNDMDDTQILEIFAGLPNLRCLYLKGNPVVEAMRNYRKTVISKLPGLTYLDERPIFDVERRCAEAWAEGGLEAERAERLQAKAKEEEKERCRFATLQRIRQDGFRKRRESLGMPAGDTDPFFEDMTSSLIEVEDDPPELVAAEQNLAQIQVSKGEENDEPAQEEWNPVRMGADEEPVVEPLRTRSAAEDNSNQLAPIQKLQEKLAPMPSTGRTQDLFFESADTAAT